MSDYSHFNSLVEKLRKKLKNFFVVNLQGQRLGKIKDIIVDGQQQLKLLIFTGSEGENSTLQLNSKQIKNIEIADKIVVVDFTIATTESSDLDKDVTLESDQARHLSNKSSRDGNNLEMLPSTSSVRNSELLAQTAMTDQAKNQTETHLNSAQDISAEEIVKLLAERVVVERKKRKIGEVIVRKEIETRMVEVPVRYEKLIVEQISPERKQIAEINLGQETLSQRDEYNTAEVTNGKQHILSENTVSGSFDSPKIVSLLLNAIARERPHACQQIRIEIVVDSPEKQKTYQEWFDRCSQQAGSRSREEGAV